MALTPMLRKSRLLLVPTIPGILPRKVELRPKQALKQSGYGFLRHPFRMPTLFYHQQDIEPPWPKLSLGA